MIGENIGSSFFVVLADGIVILYGFDSVGSTFEFWPVIVVVAVEFPYVLFYGDVTFYFWGVGFTGFSWTEGAVIVSGWVYPLPGIVLNQIVKTNLPETIDVD